MKGERQFTEIIESVQQKYPEKKAQDISVPFYFICLLHLANEKNLSISSNETLNELKIKQNC